MNSEILKQRLKTVKLTDEAQLVELVLQCKTFASIDLMEPVLSLFENNPDFNFGNPGSLVRFLETFHQQPEYAPAIYQSVTRKATEYNLLMLNRLLNALDEHEKAEGICMLTQVVDCATTSEALKELANEFLEWQSE